MTNIGIPYQNWKKKGDREREGQEGEEKEENIPSAALQIKKHNQIGTSRAYANRGEEFVIF